MRTVFEVIAIMIILFDVFMLSPFGMKYAFNRMDKGRPVYGWIFVMVSAIPFLIIAYCLGWIH